MKKVLFLFVLFLFISFSCTPKSVWIMEKTPKPGLNNKSIVSGYIVDRDSKEPMIAANITLYNGKYKGEYKAISDINGFFILKNIPPGNYDIKATYIACKPTFKPNFRVRGNYKYELKIILSIDWSSLNLP